MKIERGEVHLKGIPISPGIAVGRLFYWKVEEPAILEVSIAGLNIDVEVKRYRQAIEHAKKEIEELQKHLAAEQNKVGYDILDAHLQILNDPILTVQVIDEMREKKKNSEYLFHSKIHEIQNLFGISGGQIFEERKKDLQDIERRVLRLLKREEQNCFDKVPHHTILFAQELSPSDIVEASERLVKGFVTQNGSTTSHMAILSQAKKLPLVSSIDSAHVDLSAGDFVIIDGNIGDVIINPSPETLSRYTHPKRSESHCCLGLKTAFLPMETSDGHKVRLSANMEVIDDLERLHSFGAHGVGLFRSECLFLTHAEFPSEEEQFEVYKNIVTKMNGLPLVMRTFDLGGDKNLFGEKFHNENNPFLGCRAIRYLLREKSIFKSQLRAILRASVGGDVRILFPMISSIDELLEAKELLHEVMMELEIYDHFTVPPPLIGCMIEVPAAALIADLIAKECDFLSIGTNDLVQYTLAVDRGNHLLNKLYNPAHPSILRLIKFVVKEAELHSIPVTLCGEIAADPKFIPLLLGLGVYEFSVSLRHFGKIREAIRGCSLENARHVSDMALNFSTADAIQLLLNEV